MTIGMVRGRGLVLAAVCIFAAGCGDEARRPTGVLGQLLDMGTVVFGGLSPTYSGCGRFQPGYVPGDPTADPEVPAMICDEAGNCEVYDPRNDGWCSVQITSHHWWNGEDVIREDTIYVTEMPAPDPMLTPLPDHAQYYYEQLAAAAPAGHYIKFVQRVEARPVGDYPEEDIQELHYTLIEDASFYGSPCYRPMLPYVKGHELAFEWVMRSTRDDMLVYVNSGDGEGVDYRFRGYLGTTDTGGAPGPSEPGGHTLFIRDCEMPTPVEAPPPTFMGGPAPEECTAMRPDGTEFTVRPTTGDGPGVCPVTCRLWGPNDDGSLPQCAWEHIRALPANPDLIDPAWIEAHRPFYDEVFP